MAISRPDSGRGDRGGQIWREGSPNGGDRRNYDFLLHSRDPDCSTEGLVVISKKRGGIVIIALTVGLTAAPLYHHSTSDVGDEHRHQLGLGGHEPARSGHRDQGDQKQEPEEAEARAQAPSRGTEKESARVEHNEGTSLLQ